MDPAPAGATTVDRGAIPPVSVPTGDARPVPFSTPLEGRADREPREATAEGVDRRMLSAVGLARARPPRPESPTRASGGRALGADSMPEVEPK